MENLLWKIPSTISLIFIFPTEQLYNPSSTRIDFHIKHTNKLYKIYGFQSFLSLCDFPTLIVKIVMIQERVFLLLCWQQIIEDEMPAKDVDWWS